MSASIWSPDGSLDPSDAPPDYIYKRIWLDIVAGQTLVDFATVDPTFVYTPGLQSLEIGIDGMLPLQPVVDYTETSTHSITLVNASTDAGRLYAAVGRPISVSPSGITAALVPYTFPDGVVRSVQDLATFRGTTGIVNSAPGSGGNIRLLSDVLANTVSLNDYGAVGDGVTDDAAAFLRAFAALGVIGGTVYYNKKHVIDSLINVPANVTVKGPVSFTGSPADNGNYPYTTKAAIILNSAASLRLNGSSCLDGCLIYRKGMTFPAANAAAFAGTAVVVNGDDTGLKNCMIIGFTQGYISTNWQRPRVFQSYFDCVNCISVDTCYDVAYISQNHCWPFATVNGGVLIRTGIAYQFSGPGDWAKCTDNFAYGYFRSYRIADSDDTTLMNCSADNTQTHLNSIAYLVEGNARRTKLVACTAAAHYIAAYINTDNADPEAAVDIIEPNFRVLNSHGVLCEKGFVRITGGSIADVPNGVVTPDATGTVKVMGGTKFHNISNAPYFLVAPSALWSISDDINYGNFTGDPVVGTIGIVGVNSATTVVLPNTGNFFAIIGTTNFSLVAYPRTGRRVTLTFTAVLTCTDSVAVNGLRLAGGTFTTVAGSTLSLIGNGSRWLETARTI